MFKLILGIMRLVVLRLGLLAAPNQKWPLPQWLMLLPTINGKTLLCLHGKYVIGFWRKLYAPRIMYPVFLR